MKIPVGSRYAVPRVWDGAGWAPVRVTPMSSSPAGHHEQPHPYEFPTAAPWDVHEACLTPTYDGSGSATHPSVLDMTRHGFPDGFRGWRYWMAMTPYSGSATALENPSILVSNGGWDWQVPRWLENPIDEFPGDSPDQMGRYNSDTELVWDPDGQRFIVYWRRAYEMLHAAESTDGVRWTRHMRVLGHLDTGPSVRATILSPAIVRRGPHDWLLFAVSNQANHGIGGDTGTLRVWHATDPLGPWEETPESLAGIAPVDHLWHISVYRTPTGQFRMLANMKSPESSLRAAVSDDGHTWTYGPPFLTDGGTYRAAMQPADAPGQIDVWYSARTSSQLGSDWWIKHTRVPETLWTGL